MKFLWRQYKCGHGGLLGDDMGLVSTFCIRSGQTVTCPLSHRVCYDVSDFKRIITKNVILVRKNHSDYIFSVSNHEKRRCHH